jgi:[glutamine synthetase] adenylyltransferase / [glutamine synthetase]-adenylyl-L-tyrosine phosphorylase
MMQKQTISGTTALLPANELSRFLARWLNAYSGRESLLEEVARLSVSPAFFAEFLRKETKNGISLPQAMRRLRNLLICTLIQRDLDGRARLEEVLQTISEFADFVVQTHLQALTVEMIAAHGTPVGEHSGEVQELIVLGMGKLGGFELNVSSDIDLIFCYAEDGETRTTDATQRSLSNHEFFVRLGKKLIAAISDVAEDGFSFRVDMALRPNGNSGPLAASFNMIEEYFMLQGREWERYAWVKARAITGTPNQIAALEKIVAPFVYRRYLDFGAIDSMRSMHAQIRAEVVRQETRHPERSNNVKLGRGGIREIEFLSQVFQLIRGGRDLQLRDRSTRTTLRTLADKNILEPEIVEGLLAAYRFLRDLEHRLQYLDDAQTHTFPPKEEDQLRIAQMMGFESTEQLLQELAPHRAFVAEQFDAIFKDKQGETTEAFHNDSHSGFIAALLTDSHHHEHVLAHLESIQFEDANDAAKRIVTTWQSSRMQQLSENARNKIVTLVYRALQIIVKQDKGHSATLNRFLDFIEAIARRSSYPALLTEYPYALERVIRMMGSSEWAAKYLTRHPILLDELLDETALHQAPNWELIDTQLRQTLQTLKGDTERQMDALREQHHTVLFRLLAQDLEGDLSVEQLADALSKLADIIVGAGIQAAWETIATRHCEVPKFAVIAYGKLGGKELGYASDLDVIFLYDDDDQDAPAAYAKLAQRFITWMTTHTSAGILFDIDIALRPDGASGLLVSSVKSFAQYQQKSAWIWEHQALTRARFCAGDIEVGAQFDAIREQVLCQGHDADKLRAEVIHMRQRMRDAHPNRSELFDLKQDAGGMIDIEFIVQYLVLKYAPQYPQLSANIGNIALLKLCGELGLIDADLAANCADAYRLFRKLQHGIRLQGEDRARVAMTSVENERAQIQLLWNSLLSLEKAVGRA